jgi:hypothetical protein
MKIKSLDVQAQQHVLEDGTSSSSSIEDPPVDYEKTVESLTQALTELHMELRYRTSENEALLATASSLSEALKESDRTAQEKSLECERLQLKLQMVTFIERNDESYKSLDLSDHDPDRLHHSWSGEIELNETIPFTDTGKVEPSGVPNKSKARKKKSHTDEDRALSGKAQTSPHLCLAPASEKNHIPTTKIPYTGPVSVDDFDESSPEIGPRQAHFYNVMLERDRALSAAKKLKKELTYCKGKVKELQAKLDKSTLLVELSYRHEELQKKKQRKSLSAPEKPSPPESAPAKKLPESLPSLEPSKKAMTRKWLRTAVLSARKKEGGDEPFITVVTDDEKLSLKWNQGSKNEAAYLDAIRGNDADRAGGHESIRFQL